MPSDMPRWRAPTGLPAPPPRLGTDALNVAFFYLTFGLNLNEPANDSCDWSYRFYGCCTLESVLGSSLAFSGCSKRLVPESLEFSDAARYRLAC